MGYRLCPVYKNLFKCFHVACTCTCLWHSAGLGVSEGIRLARPTWQYYASSNITAVNSKARPLMQTAANCNTTPLKRGSCTKWTQRLPGCKILSSAIFHCTVQCMSFVSHCTDNAINEKVL